MKKDFRTVVVKVGTATLTHASGMLNIRKIEELCNKDDHVKAVFYSKNFGYAKGTFYCFQQAKGDCAVILHADLQNPPEEIP